MDDTDRHVTALVEALAAQPSSGSELGTPVLVHGRELDELVALGSAALPRLRALLPDAPAKVAAYIVLALSLIGDHAALADVREARTRFQGRDPKTEWDFAVIGQCNLAIETLTGRPGSG